MKTKTAATATIITCILIINPLVSPVLAVSAAPSVPTIDWEPSSRNSFTNTGIFQKIADSGETVPVAVPQAAKPALQGYAPTASNSVEDILKKMSIEEMVGQMVMIAIDRDIAARYEQYIKAGNLAGGLLRWDKFTGKEAQEFTQMLQGWAAQSPNHLPFLIAADHEGGPMFTQRTYGATIFPGNMALGATRSPELAEQAATISAGELKALGIHIDFGPVLDINNNPDNPIIGVRSFGEDPETVAAFGAAAIRGYLRGGILPVIKHFPGHGNTSVDSHEGLPTIPRSLEELNQMELVPFKAAIAAGAPMVMPAHIRFPAVGGDQSATLSGKVIGDLLRKDMGFGGAVVSDALDMGAISQSYGTPEAAVMAIEAGQDLLLLGKADFPAVLDKIMDSAKSHRITRDRLETSVRRILLLKKKLGILNQASPENLSLEGVGKPSHEELARRIAERSVTLLRNNEALIPLKNNEKKIFVVTARADRFQGEVDGFVRDILSRHAQTDHREVSAKPDAGAISAIVEAARNADILIIGTYQWGTAQPTEQIELVHQLEALGKPLAVISLMNPYDLRYYPEIGTLLCTYGPTTASLKAAVRVLFGDIRPAGKLPVTIPGLFPRGSGLQ